MKKAYNPNRNLHLRTEMWFSNASSRTSNSVLEAAQVDIKWRDNVYPQKALRFSPT